jgi:hypothetical protein
MIRKPDPPQVFMLSTGEELDTTGPTAQAKPSFQYLHHLGGIPSEIYIQRFPRKKNYLQNRKRRYKKCNAQL